MNPDAQEETFSSVTWLYKSITLRDQAFCQETSPEPRNGKKGLIPERPPWEKTHLQGWGVRLEPLAGGQRNLTVGECSNMPCTKKAAFSARKRLQSLIERKRWNNTSQ
jgi:hypothetical protein